MPVDDIDDAYVHDLKSKGHSTMPLHSVYLDAAFSFKHHAAAGRTLNQVRQQAPHKRIAPDTDSRLPEKTRAEAGSESGDELHVASEGGGDLEDEASRVATASQPRSPPGVGSPILSRSSHEPAAQASPSAPNDGARRGLRDVGSLQDFNDNTPGANDAATTRYLCNDFAAGEGSARRTGKEDISGLMGLFCRHGIPGLFCNIHGGERYIYAKFLLFYLTVYMHTTVLYTFYDVGKSKKQYLLF